MLFNMLRIIAFQNRIESSRESCKNVKANATIIYNDFSNKKSNSGTSMSEMQHQATVFWTITYIDIPRAKEFGLLQGTNK